MAMLLFDHGNRDKIHKLKSLVIFVLSTNPTCTRNEHILLTSGQNYSCIKYAAANENGLQPQNEVYFMLCALLHVACVLINKMCVML